MTPLEKPMRREIVIGEMRYTLAIDAEGLKLTEKGKRNGVSFKWSDLVNGDAGLAAALQASVAT